jgi:hypothetical protein
MAEFHAPEPICALKSTPLVLQNVPMKELSSQGSSTIRQKLIPAVLGALAGIFACALFHAAVWPHLAAVLGLPVFGSQPALLRQIQDLKRLETVMYTVDEAVWGERPGWVMLPLLTGDRILLLARGEVVAGVDLGKIRSEDVSLRGRELYLHLPQAEIFSVRIDSGKSRVFSRQTGLFTPADPNLESDTRRQAEDEIRAAAMRDGILKTADQNARNAMTAMGRGLGFDRVEFR